MPFSWSPPQIHYRGQIGREEDIDDLLADSDLRVVCGELTQVATRQGVAGGVDVDQLQKEMNQFYEESKEFAAKEASESVRSRKMSTDESNKAKYRSIEKEEMKVEDIVRGLYALNLQQ